MVLLMYLCFSFQQLYNEFIAIFRVLGEDMFIEGEVMSCEEWSSWVAGFDGILIPIPPNLAGRAKKFAFQLAGWGPSCRCGEN